MYILCYLLRSVYTFIWKMSFRFKSYDNLNNENKEIIAVP